MSVKDQVAQNPLILRYHRLMDAFSKSDDERDYYLDNIEGFIVHVNLSKGQKDLDALEEELETHSYRYCLIPKLTFYEMKKLMEGFVHEKVYDIDTKEKLLEIIQAKDAREHFLEFIYDHHTELEKWQQFYQERSRIRIIEWLRERDFTFVFEEDLEFPIQTVENLKKFLFETKASKDIVNARAILKAKAKTYYSNEALNPRPKRGRPPKQVIKIETEPQYTDDIYLSVSNPARPFLHCPEITSATSVTFSSKFSSEEELLANLRSNTESHATRELEALSKRLASLQDLSTRVAITENDSDDDDDVPHFKKKMTKKTPPAPPPKKAAPKPVPKVEKPSKKKLAPLKKMAPKSKPLVEKKKKDKPRRLTPVKLRKRSGS